MVGLIATAESLNQGKQLVDVGVDKVVIGEEKYGLRLAGYFTFNEMEEMVNYAHDKGAEVIVAANAILHNEKINSARDFLKQVKMTGADLLMVGDTGLIQILKEEEYRMPFIHDNSVLNTSAGQVNFWAKYGSVASLMAREVPYVELIDVAKQAEAGLIVQTYGASCIHQSGRMLLDNYFSYIGKDLDEVDEHELFLSQPGMEDTHFSIYQDDHGTHIFANHDIGLMRHLHELEEIGIDYWYNDGIYCPGDNFVEINRLFVQAREAVVAEDWDDQQAEVLQAEVEALHPVNRDLSTGFFLYDRDTVR